MSVTKLEALINPEVMGHMLSYQLEKGLKVTGFYRIDRTLQGRAGDTITIPAWGYIGMAEDVAENERVPSREMSSNDISWTVKKAAIETTLTDEAMLSAHGDPVGNTVSQLRLSLQEKIDFDGLEVLRGIATASKDVKGKFGIVEQIPDISYTSIVTALSRLPLEEQGTNLALMINRAALTTLRLDPKFYDRMTMGGDRVFFGGVVGSVAGCQVIISDRLNNGEAFILTPNCISLFMKRDIHLETEREMSYMRTKFGASVHYTPAIEDYTKMIRLEVAA